MLNLLLIHDITVPNWINATDTTTFATGGTHQGCFTYDGSSAGAGVAIYLDGVAGTSVSGNTLSGSIASGVPVAIGALHNGSAATTFFQGALGYTRIYNSVLTAGQISALYALGPQ
jgi:hypothetical protein